jgi:hypothetical protein
MKGNRLVILHARGNLFFIFLLLAPVIAKRAIFEAIQVNEFPSPL